jgi:hypothetical protein
VRRQAAVAKKPFESRPLVSSVADSLGNGRLVEDERRFPVAPREESVDDGFGFGLSDRQPRLGRGLRELSFDHKDAGDQGEGVTSPNVGCLRND